MNLIETIKGATPIEDISDLIPSHILNKDELNTWEATNILRAVEKNIIRRKKIIITVDWLKKIHKEMFDKTWKWAGIFRTRNYNIGVAWDLILEQTKLLVDDIEYWHNAKEMTIFEQSLRIHHRLVKIHPFVNGNGRHARLVSDIFLFNNAHKLPNWPNAELINETNIREKYIEALRAADNADYDLLENFTRELLS